MVKCVTGLGIHDFLAYFYIKQGGLQRVDLAFLFKWSSLFAIPSVHTRDIEWSYGFNFQSLRCRLWLGQARLMIAMSTFHDDFSSKATEPIVPVQGEQTVLGSSTCHLS